MGKPILCVDFDGVVHSYTSPWTNAATISDGPVPGALEWLWKATKKVDPYIYSSRSKDRDGIDAMGEWFVLYSQIELGLDHPMAQFIERDGRRLPSNPYPIRFCSQKPAAFLTIDDRALRFDGDWSALDVNELLRFKPWNKR